MDTESLSSLLAFVTIFQENIAAIKDLGVVDLASFILFFMGACILNPITHHLFKNKVLQEFIPTFDVFLMFIQQQYKILENIRDVESSNTRYTKAIRTLPSPQSTLTITTQIKELTAASSEPS